MKVEKLPKHWAGGTAGFGARVREDPLKLLTLFAMPKKLYSLAKETAVPKTGWLGISMREAPKPVRDPESGQSVPAIEVLRVFPSSPGDQAGLAAGDRILAVDGEPLSKPSKPSLLDRFRNAVMKKSPGQTLTLRLYRNGRAEEISAVLGAKPTTTVRLKPHERLDNKRDAHSISLLHYFLKKEKLVDDYVKTARAMRKGAAEVVSPAVKGNGPNPFRLLEVNYALYHPWDLPVLGQGITDRLHQGFDGDQRDLAGLIRTGAEALDVEPAEGTVLPHPADLTEWVERYLKAVVKARTVREQVLSSFSPEEIHALYEGVEALFVEEAGKEKGEPTEEEKKKEDEELGRFIRAALKLDWASLLNAGIEMARVLDPKVLLDLKEKHSGLDRILYEWVVVEESENLKVIKTPAGKIMVGGPGPNVYTEDAVLILDLGGDDQYLFSTGDGMSRSPFSAIVDFSGNDLYASKGGFAQGAGFLGAGFLIDLAGDDRYVSDNFSQGAAVFGVGLLADLAGNDVYVSEAVSQGAAVFGVGILVEGGGSDTYSASRLAQGFGGVKGFGAIVEKEGNDRYVAGGVFPDHRAPQKSYQSLSQGFGYGLRPFEHVYGTSGGIGVLADARGNDTYVGDYFSQGSSYWYALGILADKQGHDTYIAGRYSQGAGIHYSAGVLIDGEGDDHYLADYGVSQGIGHDLGAGFLLDNGGNDRYISGVMAQGAGNDNGIGILNDNGGDDEYRVRNLGQGRGHFTETRGLASFGVLVDTGGGNDHYSLDGKNNHFILKKGWGILVDTQ